MTNTLVEEEPVRLEEPQPAEPPDWKQRVRDLVREGPTPFPDCLVQGEIP
jgi:hypothetical protein